MKLIFRVIVVLLIVLCVLLVTKNFLLQLTVENGMHIATGLRLKMSKLNVSILKTKIEIKDLKIYNPRNFEEKIMLDMPQILIDYNLGNIIKGLIHLESVIVHLNTFNVVKNSEGKLNLDSLKVVQDGKKKEEDVKKEEPKKKGKAPKMQIDYLNLKLGSISFMDYSKDKDDPSINEFKLNLDETYEDITNPQVIGAIIVQKALMNASIAKLSGFDLGGIQNAVMSNVGDIGDYASDSLAAAEYAANKALESVQNLDEAAEGLQEAGGKAVSSLKDLGGKIKLPFGKKEE